MSEAVSHSRVESFLSCQRKEYYSYGMKIEPVKASTGQGLGTLGHEMLQVLYGTVLEAGSTAAKQKAAYPGAVIKMWEAVDKVYKEGYEDPPKRAGLRQILENYLEQEPFIDRTWSEDKRPWVILAVEKEFNFRYDDSPGEGEAGQYPFVIDVIARDPNKKIVVVDHKFTYDFYSTDDVELKPQIVKYIGALRSLGFKVHYGMYNLLRTREAPKTKARPVEEWTKTIPVRASLTRVQRTMTEQILIANTVKSLDLLDEEERDLMAVRSAAGSDTCIRMCSFRDLCIEQLRGGNTQLLLTTYYKPKKKREHIEVSEGV